MRETWEVDGFELTDGFVRDVEYRDGTNQTPVARGGGKTVVGRHGELPGQRLKYGPGQFTLSLWLGDTSPALVQADYRVLCRAMGQVHRLHDFTRGMADGSRIICRARLSEGLQPTHFGQCLMRVDAQLYVPDAFWFDEAETSDATAAGAALPKDLLLTSKQYATAPLGVLTYTIHGPITNPQVLVTSDPEVFDSFTYNGVVPAGATLVVVPDGWSVTGSGPGFVADPSRLDWTGDRYLEVPPAMPGLVPAVRLTGSGGGTATQLVVSGPGSYLC